MKKVDGALAIILACILLVSTCAYCIAAVAIHMVGDQFFTITIVTYSIIAFLALCFAIVLMCRINSQVTAQQHMICKQEFKIEIQKEKYKLAAARYKKLNERYKKLKAKRSK